MVRTEHLLLLALSLAGAPDGYADRHANDGPISASPVRLIALQFEPLPSGNFLVRGLGGEVVLSSGGASFTGGTNMRFIGARRGARAEVGDILASQSNYLLGADPGNWRTAVPNYAKVRYAGVYPGIDVIYHGNSNHLEYDVELAPGANPRLLRMAFKDAQGLALDADGDLIVHSAAKTLRFKRPIAYQQGHEVRVAYEITGRRQAGFRLGKYDRTKPLVIDPTLIYSTLLGSSNDDEAHGVAVDAMGNTYMTGFSTGPCGQLTCTNVLVTKLNAAGGLVYSTSIGGAGQSLGTAIAVDASGNAYVTGSTTAADFPAVNAFQQANAQKPATFIVKLSPNGTGFFYSTYLHGLTVTNSMIDSGYGIAVDAAGNAIVVGITSADDFPQVNPLPHDPITTPGRAKPFAAKFNSSGSALVYATFLGVDGSGFGATGVALDAAGNAYITGASNASDFPIKNSIQPLAGNSAFVTKLDPAGNLTYSTFLGTFVGTAIAVDAAGSAYITGYGAAGVPTTTGVFQPQYPGGSSQTVVTKLSASGAAIVYSTYLGGTTTDHNESSQGNGIAVDSSGNAVVVGTTSSAVFPVANALEPTTGATMPAIVERNAFIAKLSSDAGKLIYSTYFGGSSSTGAAIAVDASGQAYAAGSASVGSGGSIDFPLLNSLEANPTAGTFSGVTRAFLVQIDDATPALSQCVFSASVSSYALSSAGLTRNNGQPTLMVTPNSDVCAWQASVNAPWITISQGASGTGIARLNFNAQPNTTGASRSATLTVGNFPIAVTQDSPTSVSTASSEGVAGGVARVPLSLFVDVGQVALLTESFSAVASGSAPPISSALAFQPDPTAPPPQVDLSGGPGTIKLTWTRINPAYGLGSAKLGEILIPIPASAAAGQSYAVKNTSSAAGTLALPPAPDSSASVANPVPLERWLLPSSAAPGSAALTLTVNGEGFSAGSTVFWNGGPRITTFKSETQLQAGILPADLATAGTAQVTVTNVAPGGGTSNALPFLIAAGTPPAIFTAGIVNAASYTTQVAGGGIASIFGSGLAASTVNATNVPLPTVLAGVSVLVDGVPAPLFYISPSQINFQAPARLLNQSQATVAVIVNGFTSNVLVMQPVPAAPALFTINSQGTGQGAIMDNSTGALIGPGNPGVAGEVITIYGTGLGAIDQNLEDGSPAGSFPSVVHTSATPLVTIGGQPATVLFSGLSPQYVGLNQIDVQIPAGLPTGAASVVVTVNTVASNTVTITMK